MLAYYALLLAMTLYFIDSKESWSFKRLVIIIIPIFILTCYLIFNREMVYIYMMFIYTLYISGLFKCSTYKLNYLVGILIFTLSMAVIAQFVLSKICCVVDFSYYLDGRPARGIEFERFSGIFHEPTHFSSTILLLSFFYFNFKNKIDYILVLSLVSIIISKSNTGYILVILSIMIFYFSRIKNNQLRYASYIVIFLLPILFFESLLELKHSFVTRYNFLFSDLALSDFIFGNPEKFFGSTNLSVLISYLGFFFIAFIIVVLVLNKGIKVIPLLMAYLTSSFSIAFVPLFFILLYNFRS